MIKLEDYSEVIEKCSHCGYCQATCPVYLEDLLESHVARNRINLIKRIYFDKDMPLTDRAREIIDRCLLCTNCVQTCSSKVPIDEIIMAARSEMSSGGIGGIRKFVMNKMLTQRGLTGALGKAGSVIQKMGIASKEMPELASKTFDQMYKGTIKAEGETRARVAYFVGCGTNFMFPDTGVATVKVLSRNGVEVLIPEGQVCCGIPSIAEGDLKSAQEMVRTNVKIFADLDVDAVITDCTSCGMMMKEKFVKLLDEDDPLYDKAVKMAQQTWEVTEYLNQLGLSETPGELETTYTYHVPCPRGWSSTVKEAPRQLLAKVPGAELREMEYPEKCCGAAGTFFMDHRDLSESIRSHKIEDVKATEADLVVTQCPICRFYLSTGLKKQKEVVHPIRILARAYGFTPEKD